jgi:DNA-binding transcriptional ArsR family regulator
VDTSEQFERDDEKKPRYDWVENHRKIQDVIFAFIADDKIARMPTYDELVEKTGLGLTTIRRHLKELDLSVVNQRSKALGEMVLMRQALRALSEGEAKDVALYFKLNYGWSERYGIEVKNVDEFSDEERRERIGRLLEKGGVPQDIITKLLRGTGVVSSVAGRDESLGDAGPTQEVAGRPGELLP